MFVLGWRFREWNDWKMSNTFVLFFKLIKGLASAELTFSHIFILKFLWIFSFFWIVCVLHLFKKKTHLCAIFVKLFDLNLSTMDGRHTSHSKVLSLVSVAEASWLMSFETVYKNSFQIFLVLPCKFFLDARLHIWVTCYKSNLPLDIVYFKLNFLINFYGKVWYALRIDILYIHSRLQSALNLFMDLITRIVLCDANTNEHQKLKNN